MQVSPQRRKIRTTTPDGLDDAHAVDDTEGRRGAEIVRDGFGDARREPRQLAVAADVGEVEHRNRRQLRDRVGGVGGDRRR